MDEQDLGGTKRRTVAKGVAWSLPAVATIGAAPAYALSGKPPTLQYLGACKYPGNSCRRARKGYAFAFRVTNSSPGDVYICNAVMSNIVGLPADIVFTYRPGTCDERKIPAGTDGTFYFYFEGNKDSANQVFDFRLTIYWGHGCTCTGTGANQVCTCHDTDNHPPIVINQIHVTGTPPGGVCNCQQPFIDN